MPEEMHETPLTPGEDEYEPPPGYMRICSPEADAKDLDPELMSNLVISKFTENIFHDLREEMRIAFDSEGQEINEYVVHMAAALIFHAPTLLVNYPLPELFTRAKHILEEGFTRRGEGLQDGPPEQPR
jgi:hypothetical protein